MSDTNFRRLKRRRLISLLPLLLLLGGVAYALFASPPAVLTGNSIQTATAGLAVSTDGQNFGSSMPGFNFTHVVPGGDPMPLMGYSVYLKNTGNVALVPGLSAVKPRQNSDNIDLSKVYLTVFMIDGSAGDEQSFTLESLADGTQSLATALPPGDTHRYNLQVSIDADAVNGSSAEISGLDLVFNGVPDS